MVRWASRRAASEEVDVVLQVGDFGWWPRSGPYHRAFITELAQSPVPWVFCDGNHEDHTALDQEAGKPVELRSGVWHVPRGVQVSWSDRSFLFFGGAVSVDRHKRSEGWNWFREEIASAAQRERALAAGRVDVVVAHDVPDGDVGLDLRPGVWPDELTEESAAHRRFCSELVDSANPALWLAGHYHQRTTGTLGDTTVEVYAGSGQRPWEALTASVLDIPTLGVRALEPGPG